MANDLGNRQRGILPFAHGRFEPQHTVFIANNLIIVFRKTPQIRKLLDSLVLLYGQTIAH
jgi:hypothetical protein